MKKRLLAIIAVLMLSISVYATPFLISDPNPDLMTGAVFQLMIDGMVQTEIYPVVDNAVKIDVQDFEGQKTIRARYGNPYPDVPNTYKWSDWSDPMTYTFPTQPTKPSGCRIGS